MNLNGYFYNMKYVIMSKKLNYNTRNGGNNNGSKFKRKKFFEIIRFYT